MEYPLLALKLLKKECGKLIAIIKDAGIPKSSIYRKLPIGLVHRATNYLGLGMDDLYILQDSYQN